MTPVSAESAGAGATGAGAATAAGAATTAGAAAGAGAEAALAGIRAAAAAVHARMDVAPRVGIVLGTGLGGLADHVAVRAVIPYSEIPGFPSTTAAGHAGRLLLGDLEQVPVAVLDGRAHRYEGHSLAEVTRPVRVLRELGADVLLVSNAAGGMNPLWSAGDLVLISDHINFMGENPLVGPNLDALGPRFPDMSRVYDADLRRIAREEALRLGIPLREGVYVAVTGPNLETAAEYRMLRGLGADLVGMSTVPEVIVARHGGMRVLGLSVLTDMGLPDALEPVDVERILAVAGEAAPSLVGLVRAVVARLPGADGPEAAAPRA